METTFFLRFKDLCRNIGRSPNNVARELGIPSGSVTAWKQGATPRSATVLRLADYFNVSVDYLSGKSDVAAQRPVTKEEIKFALFGGDGEISDAMFEEVCQFAQFVKHREGLKKKE